MGDEQLNRWLFTVDRPSSNMNQTIFVTGGTGFIGSYLLRNLVKQGKKVRALKRPTSPMNLVQDIASQIEWVEGDILDIIALEDAMQGVHQVYHCAAVVSYNPEDYHQIRKINVEGTANVVNVALDFGIQKLLHVSSIAALGRTKDKKNIDESAKWERSKLNTQYAISKYQAEQEIWRGAEEGLKVVIVNPSIVLGAGFWHTGPAHFFQQLHKGLRFYPTGITGFVDVRDVAAIMTILMDSPIEHERFVVNSENLPYADVFNQIADVIGVKRPSIKVTPFLRETAWRLEWLKSKITGKKAFITKETARNSGLQYFYSSEKLLNTIDFEYRPIRQTIEETGQVFLGSLDKGFGVLEF